MAFFQFELLLKYRRMMWSLLLALSLMQLTLCGKTNLYLDKLFSPFLKIHLLLRVLTTVMQVNKWFFVGKLLKKKEKISFKIRISCNFHYPTKSPRHATLRILKSSFYPLKESLKKKLTNQVLNNLKLEYLNQLQFTPFNFFLCLHGTL